MVKIIHRNSAVSLRERKFIVSYYFFFEISSIYCFVYKRLWNFSLSNKMFSWYIFVSARKNNYNVKHNEIFSFYSGRAHMMCVCFCSVREQFFYQKYHAPIRIRRDSFIFFFVAFWILLVGRGGHFMIFPVVSLPNNKIERLKRYYYSIIYGN